MQKFIVLLVITFISLSQVYAQDPACVPDPSYADSLAGVYPGPYHPEDFPNGGIHDTAYIGQEFEFVLTAVISDSLTVGDLKFKMDYLKIEEDGVLNLPIGLDYACNPPDCIFEANSLGCMLISGTPTSDNTIGNYDLKLKSQISVLGGVIVLNDTLPQMLIDGSHYYLYVDVVNNTEIINHNLGFRVLTNPVVDKILIEFEPEGINNYRVDLVDMNGSRIKSLSGKAAGPVSEVIDISGDNADGHSIANGYYFLRLITDKGTATEKVLILSR